MKIRAMITGMTVLLGILLISQGSSETKTYKISEPGKTTATLTYPGFIEIGSFDGQSVEGMLSHVNYEGKTKWFFLRVSIA